MQKVIITIFAFVLLIVPASAALGNWTPTVRINGELQQFDPGCQIVNQRIMVPLRFVIEGECLQGSVLWNGDARQVNVTCMGRNFEFRIGSSGVLIDGKLYQLDSPPYIYQNRTYLPLRFFAENLGGKVTWNSSQREASIFFGSSPANSHRVFAYYYWGGFPELQENADLFSDVALRWFETNSQGDLFYEYQDNYSQVLSFLKQRGIKAHASVVFMDKDGLHALLSSPARRSHLIDQLCAQVQKNSYDGVNIDFEFIPAADSGCFTAFLQELSNRLDNNKELSVAVFARTAADKWPTAYNYRQIGQIADRVVVMSYDYHYKTSGAGAVAPLWWVEDVINYMRSNAGIPASKLLIGMATYGYDWANGLNTTTVTEQKLEQLSSRYRLNAHYDPASSSPYYTYTDSSQVSHQIWLENERSLDEKLQLVKNNDLGGISFWRIGNGFEDLYNLLERDPLL